MTAADRFREIDTWAAEAHTFFGVDEDRKAAFGLLTSIQMEARKGLREALANQPKLETFDGLLAACKRAKGLYDYLALGPFGAAAEYGPDHDYERISDEECLATRGALEAAIANAKEQTAPGAEVSRA